MNDTVWLHYSLPRTAWYELPEQCRDAREQEFERQRGISRSRGATCSGRFHVRGQGDYSHLEVWFFPDVEHAFDHWSRLVSAGYAEWYAFANQTGMHEGAPERARKERES